MCAYSVAWNEATPAGSSTNASTIDTELQNLKTSIRERMNNILHSSGDWGTDSEEPKLVDIAALAGTPVVAVLYHSASQNITTTSTVNILWDSETLDTGGLHDTGSNTEDFKIVTAGYYRIVAMIAVTAGAGTDDIVLSLRKGTTVIRQITTPSTNLDKTTLTISEIVLAAVDDTYDLIVTQSSGGTAAVVGGVSNSSFQIEKLNGTT